jgi:TolA-binding protein
LNRYADAADAARQGIRANPKLSWAYYWLGHSDLALGDRAGAIEQYKVLQTLDQNLANLLFKEIYK